MFRRLVYLPLLQLISFSILTTHSQPPPSPPYPSPQRPTPFWTWDTIPLAHHGANFSGLYSPTAIAQLSQYRMVTIEKWYTPCASNHPSQGNATCDVESKIFTTFHALKALSPQLTAVMYLNSMFDFDFYHLNGIIQAREANGEKLLLRDRNDVLVTLCNDGDFYCNVTFFDHTVPAMRELWLEAVSNATRDGLVDGIFADHANQMIVPGTDGTPELCNGTPQKCFYFTQDFANNFNEGHAWIVNASQDMLSKRSGSGPVIDGPFASYDVSACDFTALRSAVLRRPNTIIEASKGDNNNSPCLPDDSCVANFLAAAEKYTYFTCLSSGSGDTFLPPFIPEFLYSLGEPNGPPVMIGSDGVERNFTSAAGITTARVNLTTGVGQMSWAGVAPSKTPSASPSPLPQSCGTIYQNTAISGYDVTASTIVNNSDECCALCKKANTLCTQWCYHGEEGRQNKECHLHSKLGLRHSLVGATSGVLSAY